MSNCATARLKSLSLLLPCLHCFFNLLACFSNQLGAKAPSPPCARVFQEVLVKIVTEILFGNAPLANHGTIVLAAARQITTADKG